MYRKISFVLSLACCLLASSAAKAHFPFVVLEPSEQAKTVKVYFSELAEPDNPDLLDRLLTAEVWVLESGRSKAELIPIKKGADALEGSIPEGRGSSIVALKQPYGVITRGDATFLLQYYAKAYPSALAGSWKAAKDKERLPLELTPRLDGKDVVVKVTWQGDALANSEVVIDGPGFDSSVKGTTDEKGNFRFPLKDGGLYSMRAKHVETATGKHEDKEYSEVRHYSTLTVTMQPSQIESVAHTWPELPKGITSFGGAVVGDWLYIYGGHYGGAHHYSKEGQSGDFLRLNLVEPTAWETLPGGPKVTGLGMVAHGGKVYRIGGFTAENAEGEDQVLRSQTDFARFDPETKTWESLTPLPEARSSLDAAVIGDTLYVAGGWELNGSDSDTKWHDTAWSIDLSSESLVWKALPQPPFRRRAVSLAECQGKLYCLGGMRETGGPTTEVAVFDPAKNEWAEAPALLGSGMDGFGTSSFASGGRLYVTTMSGSVQRLNEAGDRWENVGQLADPRFFHRLLPWNNELVIVGGASMETGKIQTLERLRAPADQVAEK